jgi:ArpU family phage transcriptional regulator
VINLDFELPELDRELTKQKVEEHLWKYRMFKYLTFEEREASITASPEPRYHGATNQTSDQTGSIAIHNADEQAKRKHFCERTERAVKHLPPMERFLIEQRYMAEDSEYITDFNVYCHKFQPPISHVTYSKIRWKAFYRLALNLNIAVTKDRKKPFL